MKDIVKKEDARVIKTKAKLFESFRNLLAKNQFENITVNDLCIAAEVRRATFYKHFSDKYDFLAAFTLSYIEEFETRYKKNSVYRTGIDSHINFSKALMEFLIENEAAIKMLFESNMTSSLLDIIIKQFYENIKERLEADIKAGESLIATADTIATILSGGIGNLLICWFAGERKTSKEDILFEIEAVVRAMFVS